MTATKKTHSIAFRNTSAFSLIELIAVIAIIISLVGISVGVFRYSKVRSIESRVRAEIKMLELALDSYKVDHGEYPQATSNPHGNLVNATNNAVTLYKALSGNAAGTDLVPDSTNKAYFTSFKFGKSGNLATNGSGEYFIIDSMDAPYHYLSGSSGSQSNKVTFDLWSLGVDQTDGTADDIANWKF